MGKALLVTGGSRGIGAAVSRLAAASGWSVAVNYARHQAAAEAVVAEIKAAGGQAVAIPGDVAIEADVLSMFDAAEAALGPVAGLVNNAGILRRATPFAQIELARWEEMFAVNTRGSFLCAREAVRRMSTALGGTGGAIVNLSSMAAVIGGPNEFVDYAASKGAIDTMTIGLAKELGPQGIRVNGVRPGLIDTEMQADSGDPDRARRLGVTAPLGRPGTPDEVAQAVVWLLSDAASYVTGMLVNVSGGR